MKYKIIECLLSGETRDIGKTVERPDIKSVFAHYGFQDSNYLSYYKMNELANGEYGIIYNFIDKPLIKLIPIHE